MVNALADIDGSILHWEYKPSKDNQTWEQKIDGVIKTISVCNDRKSEAHRQNENSDRRKISAFCKNNITDDEIVEFLEYPC